MKSPVVTRRTVLKTFAASAALGLSASAQPQPAPYRIKNGRIRQSVVPWCFNPMPVPELARHAAALGLQSVELCDPKFWPELKQLGLTCAIAGSHGFAKGFANLAEHDECLATLRKRILRGFVARGLLEKADAKEMLAYQHSGFSVDAGVCIQAHDRAALERLLRYCARPPFAMERLRKEGAALVYRCAKQRSELALTSVGGVGFNSGSMRLSLLPGKLSALSGARA